MSKLMSAMSINSELLVAMIEKNEIEFMLTARFYSTEGVKTKIDRSIDLQSV